MDHTPSPGPAANAGQSTPPAGMERRTGLPFLLIHVAMPIMIGAAMYTLWRSTRLYVFTWYRWMGITHPGVITLVTDKAKLQNGFGAFQHIVLQCDYDTQSKKVLGYRSFAKE
jgi:hypothetical protein